MSSFLFDTTSKRRLIFLWVLLISAAILTSSMLGWLGSLDYELASVRGDGIVNLELAWNKNIVRDVVDGWQQGVLIATAKKSIYWDFLLILGYATTLLSGFALALGPLRRLGGVRLFILYIVASLPIFAALFDIFENLLMLWTLSDEGNVGAIRSMLTAGFAYTKFTLLGLFVFAAMYLARPALRTFARVRFSILMLVVCVALLFVAQWQEILRAIMEANNDAGINWNAVFLACASLIAAISTWYSARVLFMFCVGPKNDDNVEDDNCTHDPMTNLKRWLPRVIGAMVIVVVSLGFFISAPFGRIGAAIEPVVYQLVALLLFFIVVLYRRVIFDLPQDSRMIKIDDGFNGLNLKTKLPLTILAVGNVLCFLFFLFFPEYAVNVGAAAVAVFAIALIVPWGSLLVHYGTKWDYPVLSVVAVLAVIFSMTNDNHSVRLCKEMGSAGQECPVADDKETTPKQPISSSDESQFKFAAFMDQWVNERKSGNRDIPVFIVAAEGGGIRAAFWTAHVLATLQDQACAKGLDFSKHLLAISGVSGGSLGGAVFAASVKRLGSNCQDNPTGYSKLAHSVLGNDFLSPTVATFLFPDLLQRVLPVPLFDDRAITLEKSWELAWKQGTNNDDFAGTFGSLWPSTDMQAGAKPPMLLLNSTVVETGKRLIMSSLSLKTDDLKFAEVFRDAVDGYTLVGDKIPLSTAVHLSARFTYVSPAGKVFSKGSKNREPGWSRLVDGGYFENSGAVTATELLNAVNKYMEQHPDVPLKPFVIHISNEPIIPDSERARKQISYNPVMGEVLSPLRALLNVRPARGFQAREFLQRKLEDDGSNIVRHVHFLPCKCELDLPLGWMLSEAVQEDLISQFPLIEEGKDSLSEKTEDLLKHDRKDMEVVLKDLLGWTLPGETLEDLSQKFIPDSNKKVVKKYNLENMNLVLQHLSEGEATGKLSSDREAALIQSCRQNKPLSGAR